MSLLQRTLAHPSRSFNESNGKDASSESRPESKRPKQTSGSRRSSYANMPQESKNANQNPFVQSQHGNPNFQPIKVGSKGAEGRFPKPPKAPEKPLMPYMRYSRKVWEQVKNAHPQLKLWEVGKIIGQMWRELPDDEKAEYVEEYEAEKIQYNEAMRQYHNSPQYQAWLAAKERAEKGLDDAELDHSRSSSSRRSGAEARSTEGISTAVGSGPGEAGREAYIQEETDEEPGLDDHFSAKHVASARFQRNHCLMQELLSDRRMPDIRQYISNGRLRTLKRQVEQLMLHEMKLKSDIADVENRHEEKKRIIEVCREDFQKKWSSLCTEKPKVSKEEFDKMVSRAKEAIAQSNENSKTDDDDGALPGSGRQQVVPVPMDNAVAARS